MKVRNSILSVWEFLKGKKSYIAGIAAIVYGLCTPEKEMLFVGLGLLGLRHGLTTEVSKLLKQ